MKAGIWGWFHRGNYGDELMALYVAESLRALGVSPRFHNLRPTLAHRHGLQSEVDIDAFFQGLDFCVFAEGGCLVDAADGFNNKGERYARLIAAAKRHRVPLYPLSIGGNGTGAGARPRGEIHRLWKTGLCGESVVRLPGDVALVESFGGRAKCIPDMLWEAAEVLGIPAPSPQPETPQVVRVGINLLRDRVAPGFAEWVDSQVPSGVEITWLAAHTESAVRGELRPHSEHLSRRVKIFRHDDPLELLEFVGSKLDLLVSSKLHVGLTALSQGTVFVSCHGRAKTHAQLATLGEGLTRSEDNAAEAVLRDLFADPPGVLAQWRGRVSWSSVEANRQAAAGNRAWLRRWRDRHRGGLHRLRSWWRGV